jgi:hypothetical protein
MSDALTETHWNEEGEKPSQAFDRLIESAREGGRLHGGSRYSLVVAFDNNTGSLRFALELVD